MDQPSSRHTLPARFYTDPDVYHDELESFFFNGWICAGRADAIPKPGDYFLRQIAGESVLVVRQTAWALRAFYNVCRHRGTRLCTDADGHLAGRIQCPYHGWTYGLDGQLIGAPHMEDTPGFSADAYPLRRVHIADWDGHVFLHFGDAPEPLTDRLADLPGKLAPWRMHELRLHRRIVYDVRANWKLVILNYSECLHCPILHPALNRLTDYRDVDNDPPHPAYLGGAMDLREGVDTMSVDGKRRHACLPHLNAEQQRRVYYYVVYPNLLVSLHPDYVMTHTLWPRAVDRTEIVCEWRFHPEEMAKRGFSGDDAVDFWDQTNREDWRIVELSQEGIQSRAYTPGPYSPRESLLHAFDQIVLERERSAGRRPDRGR